MVLVVVRYKDKDTSSGKLNNLNGFCLNTFPKMIVFTKTTFMWLGYIYANFWFLEYEIKGPDIFNNY